MDGPMVKKWGVCLETKPRCILHMGGVHLHVLTCVRADVPPFTYLGNTGRIALKFGMWLESHHQGFLQKLRVGHSCTCAPLFSYLGNGWTDCAEICYVVRDPLAKRFTKADVRYVRTCSCARRVQLHPPGIPSPYLGNGWTDCTEIWCVASGPVTMEFYTGWEILH